MLVDLWVLVLPRAGMNTIYCLAHDVAGNTSTRPGHGTGKKMLPQMYFIKSRFGVILDSSTNGSICLRSTHLWLWARAVISGRGQDKEGPGWRGRHSGEGMRKSSGFKEKGWRLERGRKSMWGQNEEQRRLKGARRREKEHATSRKMGKGAAGSVWARNSPLWSYGILKRVMDDCFMDEENI